LKYCITILSLIACYKVHAFNLQIKVEGLKGNQGVVGYLLFDKEVGFPDQSDLSLRSGAVEAKEIHQSIQINNLEPGKFAIVLLHDQNRSKSMDKNFFGIPKEGFGFSNNPTIYLGPPSFEKAHFELQKDETIIIKMKYI